MPPLLKIILPTFERTEIDRAPALILKRALSKNNRHPFVVREVRVVYPEFAASSVLDVTRPQLPLSI